MGGRKEAGVGGEKSGNLLAFAGGFCALSPVAFHGFIFQMGKTKERLSELLQDMSRSLWEAENVQLSGKNTQVLNALPKRAKP